MVQQLSPLTYLNSHTVLSEKGGKAELTLCSLTLSSGDSEPALCADVVEMNRPHL